MDTEYLRARLNQAVQILTQKLEENPEPGMIGEYIRQIAELRARLVALGSSSQEKTSKK